MDTTIQLFQPTAADNAGKREKRRGELVKNLIERRISGRAPDSAEEFQIRAPEGTVVVVDNRAGNVLHLAIQLGSLLFPKMLRESKSLLPPIDPHRSTAAHALFMSVRCSCHTLTKGFL